MFVLFQDKKETTIDYVEIEEETPEKMKVSGMVWLAVSASLVNYCQIVCHLSSAVILYCEFVTNRNCSCLIYNFGQKFQIITVSTIKILAINWRLFILFCCTLSSKYLWLLLAL